MGHENYEPFHFYARRLHFLHFVMKIGSIRLCGIACRSDIEIDRLSAASTDSRGGNLRSVPLAIHNNANKGTYTWATACLRPPAITVDDDRGGKRLYDSLKLLLVIVLGDCRWPSSTIGRSKTSCGWSVSSLGRIVNCVYVSQFNDICLLFPGESQLFQWLLLLYTYTYK